MYLSSRLFKSVSGPEHSFSVKKEVQPYFYDRFHHHPEYEFSYIESGEGIRFVGDRIEPFYAGEFILLGPNLSHMWKCDARYYQMPEPKACSSYVIHFTSHFIDQLLQNTPELSSIKLLLDKSRGGLNISGKVKEPLAKSFKKLPKLVKGERLIGFLQILNLAAAADDVKQLSQAYVLEKKESEQSERINVIYNYLLGSFQQKVTLEDAAAIAHLSPTAFCRYFKQKTGKNFTEVLSEIRINHACRLLIAGNEKIAQVALASGYNNLSHFNKQFKAIVGKTPRDFLQP